MKNCLTIMLMAMLVDGKVHDTQVHLIENYNKLYPRFDGLSEGRIQTSAVELNRKLNSGSASSVVSGCSRHQALQATYPADDQGAGDVTEGLLRHSSKRVLPVPAIGGERCTIPMPGPAQLPLNNTPS
jgi:hypothetical protein